MAEIIQLRRDRSNSWATINPILAQGEIGYELDTNRFKIGDGLHSWRDLDYFASSSLQVNPMPSANASNLNKIVEYVGNNTQSFTNGYFYKCKKEADKEVTWELNVQSDVQINTVDIPTFVNYIALNFTDEDKEQAWDLMLGDITVTYNDSFSEWVVLSDDSEISFSIADLSELGIDMEGTPVDNDYFTLHFQDGALYTYKWNQVNVQPETAVIDALTSTSYSKALSANQGRVLKDLIDNVQSIGRFLAMWDADTGIARYLDLGFEYEQGDYFIIATVATHGTYDVTAIGGSSADKSVAVNDVEPWENYFGKTAKTVKFTMGAGQYGLDFTTNYDAKVWTKSELENDLGIVTTNFNTMDDWFNITYTEAINYMPDGATYTGASTTVTSDPIEVSDMYFYTGSRWVYLENHQRQVAVDEYLDPESRNPVENRVVTNALAGKVDKPEETEVMLYVDDEGAVQPLYLGNGLEVDNTDGFILNNTKAGEWGSIEGDITDQTDLIEYIAEHGGSSGGGEGIGTLNISNVFCKPADLITPDQGENSANQYKGDYRHIFFTVNADLDYIKQNREDIYITYSRRNCGDYLRKFRILDDNRKGINIKMHCWRVPTHRFFNSTYETFDYDYNDNYHNDINYEYFYTADNYGDDVETLLENNPYAFYSDLRKEGDSYEDDNYSCGNWGTCLNELQNGGPLSDLYDGRDASLEEVERCGKYDISEIAMDASIIWNPKEDGVQWLYRMKGRLYKNSAEEKLYAWSHEWYFDEHDGEVFAYLDDNDDPVLNRVPEDKRKIRHYCTEADLGTNGWTLVEERPDLTYWYFPSASLMEVERFVQHCRNCTKNCADQSGNRDMNWRCYFWDYPIVPVRISQCKIFFADEAPHVYNEDTGKYENDYADEHYVNHAFTLEEIENDPGLQQMLSYQKQLIFVYPYDTHHLWMRTFGWQKVVYTHVYRESQWHEDEEYYDPWIQGYQYHWEHNEESDQYYIVPDYDPETGEIARENIVIWAKPWDRHNLMRGMFLGGQRNLGYGDGTSMNSGMGDLDNKMGKIQGGKYPKWSMRRGSVYLQPIEFNIASGHEVSFGFTSKSTPFEVQLRISGEGGQNVYR